VLRNHAIKQVVVFTRFIGKPGVKKQLAIGDIVKGRLNDSRFVIPIRAGDIAFTDAPPEFIRTDILNAYPNWHDCLNQLFETLEEAQVPKEPQPNTEVLRAIIDAREHGRRFVIERPEAVLTNWFAPRVVGRVERTIAEHSLPYSSRSSLFPAEIVPVPLIQAGTPEIRLGSRYPIDDPFANHDHGCMGTARPGDPRHHRCIGYPQAFDALHSAVLVDDCHWIRSRSHLTSP